MNRWDFARKPSFGKRQDAAEPLAAKALVRKTGEIGRLAESLPALPGPGEAVHLLMTGRYDLTAVLAVILQRQGPCATMRVATLSFNSGNVAELAGWLDAKQIGSLTLLASEFHRQNSTDDWQAAVNDLRKARGVRLAAARNHAKVVILDWADGRTLGMEGSANLRTNSNQEQLTVLNDPAISTWHSAWIDALVSKHECDDDKPRKRRQAREVDPG